MSNTNSLNKNKDVKLVRVWRVNLKDGQEVRVATIEQGPRKPSMCEGCPAPCCQGIFRPVLTAEEFFSKKFPTKFIDAPDWLKKQVPRAEKLAVLAFTENSYCNYFDPQTQKCKIFPNCPKACLAYDCREDPRPEIKKFAKMREKEFKKFKKQ
uniref:YkgJ family cysteine cluster protein n=1 Tax=candidate division CPR3 bacterium TaxID=2268181 RepID=A0A7C4M5Z5_UNCC3